MIDRINSIKGVRREYDEYVRAYIWKNVPKSELIELVSKYKSHPWNLNFQSAALSKFIDRENGLEYWDVALPMGSAGEVQKIALSDGTKLIIHGEARKISKDNTVDKMLRVNDRHIRVGAGGCTKIGLDANRIQELRKAAGGKPTDKTYLVEDRRPIALLHLMYNTNEELAEYPKYIYAIGLGFPGGKTERKAQYIVNTIDLINYVDVEDINDEDDDVS